MQTKEPGYRYYQLVVGESMEVLGAFEWLRFGVSISIESDYIAHGWLGRKSDTTIALI
jgi:hypothetical protein